MKQFIFSFYFLLSVFYANVAFSQTSKAFQSWNSIGANFELSKKSSLSISELASFTPSNKFNLNFAQTSLKYKYDITKIITISLGDQINIIPGSINHRVRNKVFLRGDIENKFSDVVKAEHSLQFEFHSNEPRYSQRAIFINRIAARHRITPLKMMPSLSYWLYYNMGGNPVQYFDKTGTATAMQSANGFHRGRLFLNLNFKVTQVLRLSLYYMNQKEFNLLTSTERKINVLDPNTGKIKRPFDDYSALGLSLQFSFGND